MKLNTMLSVMALAATVSATPVMATTTYITNFDKTSNIYTNLMQQFPNTGPGVPGSRMGVANASTTFTPTATGTGNPDNLNYANNGVSYRITSDAQGRDFTEVGSADFGVSTLTMPLDVAGATNFYLLGAAYNGTSFNITLAASDGFTKTFTGIPLPDFNGGIINSSGAGYTSQTVFRAYGVGAGGTGNSTNGSTNYYSLTQVGFDLGSDFSGRTLTSATITGNGYETLVLGATVISPDVAGAVPEPAQWALFIGGFGAVGVSVRRRRTPRPATA